MNERNAAPERPPIIERVGSVFAYAYVLRVPIIIWAILVLVPVYALPKGSALGPALRGVFDVSPGGLFPAAVCFFLTTFAALMCAASLAITSRLILLDGAERFGLPALQLRAGLDLGLRVLALAVPLFLVGSALWQTRNHVSYAGAAIGVIASAAVFVLMMRRVHRLLRGLTTSDSDLATQSRAARWLRTPLRLLQGLALRGALISPQGYIDRSTGQLLERHALAFHQLLLSVVLYGLLFVAKRVWTGTSWMSVWLNGVFSGHPVVPTLCLALVLAIVGCFLLTAITFFADRFRIPALLVAAVYAWFVAGVPQADYFVAVRSIEPPPIVSPSSVLALRAGRPAIVVAAAGGGIHAAAWTARVLAGLRADIGPDFDRALLMISSVSGGSVGAMHFLSAYDDTGALPEVPAQGTHPAVVAAEGSSLDAVAWGLVYPDLVWAIAPYAKGVSIWPPNLFSGPNLTSDRGTALERAWRDQSALAWHDDATARSGRPRGLEKATLARWREDVARHTRPAFIFNATLAETGERFLLGTTDLDTGEVPPTDYLHTTGRRSFRQEHARADMDIATAARLSATFPFVTPAARVINEGERGAVFRPSFHIVDGGYYDNYGIATLVEWLDEALHAPGPKPSRILLLQIRTAAKPPPVPDGRHGWSFQTTLPLRTVLNVGGSGQLAHSDIEAQCVRLHSTVPLDVVSFEFPLEMEMPRASGAGGEQSETIKMEPPLSWHLTAEQKEQLRSAWESSSRVREARRAVAEAFAPQ